MVTARILLLGSGELGRELVISLKRLGCEVIACDSYAGAPAMQVADAAEVFDMLDADALSAVIDRHRPDHVVPEIEAIATDVLVAKEADGYSIIPSANAAHLTMNRDKIRDRAARLGLRTARFAYAETEEALVAAAADIGGKVVIKPVMSSSGKGQSTAEGEAEVRKAWAYAMAGMRGSRQRVIVEEFIDFDYEITLLTVRQRNGETLFCAPIGHVQERGDYQYSWQPAEVESTPLAAARKMAERMTAELGGAGLFGVEFFVKKDGEVVFSELSPRPHDTGMVTLFTQSLSEFDLHARALLGLPIPQVTLIRPGASHVILAPGNAPVGGYGFTGLDQALAMPEVDVRLFGKPVTRPWRRMGVALAPTLDAAREAAGKVQVISETN